MLFGAYNPIGENMLNSGQFPNKMILEAHESDSVIIDRINSLRENFETDVIGIKIKSEKVGFLNKKDDSKGFYAITIQFSNIAAKTSEIETKRSDFLEEAEKYFNSVGMSFNPKNIGRNKLVINDGAPYEDMFKLAYKNILWEKPRYSFF